MQNKLQFNSDGLLPPGDYVMNFTQLYQSVLVNRHKPKSDTWDREWRSKLVDNLQILVGHLWQVGITEIYIDGSFVEDKDHPNDIDGYFECEVFDFLKIQPMLYKLDSCWTWKHNQRKPYRGTTKRQLPMWHKYRIELYPHYPSVMSGIIDEFGNNQSFPAAFRKTRGNPRKTKGIIKLIK